MAGACAARGGVAEVEIELRVEGRGPGDQYELVGAGLGARAIGVGLANLAADEAVGREAAALDQTPDRELDLLLGGTVGDEAIDDLAHGHAGVRVSFDHEEHGVLQRVGHSAARMARAAEADKVRALDPVHRREVGLREAVAMAAAVAQSDGDGPATDPAYHRAMSVRILCSSLALVLGCATATPASPEPVGAASEGAASEAAASRTAAPEAAGPPAAQVDKANASDESELVSVRPGVNDQYMIPDAAETWTDRLERERREVIAERDDIVAALELAPGMTVADIGAGTGAFMQALSVELGDSGTLYEVDIIPQFLAHLRERAAADALANVVVVEASATATNLPDDSVDLIFLCDVYHHLEHPAVYLRSLDRALRPGGRMVIVEFAKIPGKTTAAMMKHVRQDKATLLAEVTAEGFVLEREIDSVDLEENYMLEFRQ